MRGSFGIGGILALRFWPTVLEMSKDKNGTVVTVKKKIKRWLGSDVDGGSVGGVPADLIRAAELKAAYSAIYIIAPKDQKWPVSIGITSNPSAAYHSFQKGWWEEHKIHVLLWADNDDITNKLKRLMGEAMAHQRRFFSRSWYDATVEEAERLLTAITMAQGIQLFDDVEKHQKIFYTARTAWEKRNGVVPQVQRSASNVLAFTRGRKDAKKSPKEG